MYITLRLLRIKERALIRGMTIAFSLLFLCFLFFSISLLHPSLHLLPADRKSGNQLLIYNLDTNHFSTCFTHTFF
jgi:hypothetical protein